jgi:two-component sensor histidine kinase
LIQNALEHGLVNSGKELIVSVRRADNELLIEVIDDGSGLPENFSIDSSTTLGLQIVQTLTTNELAGELNISQNLPTGTKAEIRLTIF